MATVNVKELVDVTVIPTYETYTNVIKSVNYTITVYDDVVGANTNISLLQQSVLSAEDLAANNFITANSTITQTEIINWAHTNLGGDEAAADLISYAETKLADSIYLADGTSDYDFSINPL